MMMRRFKIPVLALWLSSLIPLTSSAVDVNFTATLINNPPCDVAGPGGVDEPIKVEFGEVGITKINGENYRQNFTLTLSCGPGLGDAVALSLVYRGMQADFDTKALQATPGDLGIRLYGEEEGVIAPLSSLPIVMSSNGSKPLSLYAVPVKNTDPSATLYEGPFSATASMELNYP